MTRLIIEGITFQIDDSWEKEDNGKKIYFDLNKHKKANIPDNLSCEDAETELRFKSMMTHDRDYSGTIKNELIDACEKILEIQAEEGKRSKGRSCEQIAHMTSISEYYVRNYLCTKHGKQKQISEEERRHKQTVSDMKATCRKMKYLVEDLENLDWHHEGVDYTLLYARSQELLQVLKSKVMPGFEDEQ